jgi:hypothetical protein
MLERFVEVISQQEIGGDFPDGVLEVLPGIDPVEDFEDKDAGECVDPGPWPVVYHIGDEVLTDTIARSVGVGEPVCRQYRVGGQCRSLETVKSPSIDFLAFRWKFQYTSNPGLVRGVRRVRVTCMALGL